MTMHRRIVTGYELGAAIALNVNGTSSTIQRTYGIATPFARGRVVGLLVRIGTKTGAGTLDSLRCVIASGRHLGASVPATGALVPADAKVYDTTEAAPAHSTTEPCIQQLNPDAFQGGYSDGLYVYLDYVCTNAVACEIVVTLLLEEDT